MTGPLDRPALNQPGSRGILNQHLAQDRFRLDRYPPAADLAWAVERYWTVAWDLTGQLPHIQETLPYPCVNLVFEPGATAVFGVVRRRFERRLEGRGRVFGIKFKPGGFQPLLGGPVSALTDRAMTLAQAFSDPGDIEARVLGAIDDMPVVIGAVEDFLRARLPAPDPTVARLNILVDRIVAERQILRVDDLADLAGLGARSLQRLFGRYVGVGPKWVIARYRLHEAAERLAAGGRVDLAELAQDLGYFDQPHFIRDFRRLVGRAPGDYAQAMRG